MLYVTNRNLYFYSPFNDSTLVGHGTKNKISFSAIESIKKAHQVLLFGESIRIKVKAGPDVVFTSFLSREVCFELIEQQILEFKKAN